MGLRVQAGCKGIEIFMKNLKRTLFSLPIIIVAIVCIAVLLIFNIVVTQFVNSQVSQSMNAFKDYHMAMDNLQESLEDMSSDKDRSSTEKSKIESEMMLLTESYNSNYNAVATQMVVLDDQDYINEYATDVEKKLIAYYNENSEEVAKEVIAEAKIDKETYCISTARFRVYNDEKSNVLIYTNISAINNMISSFNKVLLIVIAAVSLAAIIVGFIMTHSISVSLYALKDFIYSLGREKSERNRKGIYYTEFTEMADFMENLSDELLASQKLQKLIFQNASHELRTPLMSIQGYAEGISTNVLKNHQSAADIIITESKKMSDLVDEMLFISRMDENPLKEEDMTVIDLRQIIEYCREEVCVIGDKKGVVIIESLDGGRYFVKAEERQITKALSNVMSNGIRYAENKLAITASCDEEITITIADDGKGISEADLPHVFERFYKGEGGNFGIGLAITKEIVERHGGSIIAENMEKGARFTIKLPAVAQEELGEETVSNGVAMDDVDINEIISSIPDEDKQI